MKYVIVKDGGEEPLAMATAYVESLGIPRNQVRRITVNGEVGQPLIVAVELFVPAPEILAAHHSPNYGHGHDFQDAGDGLCKVCDEAHDPIQDRRQRAFEAMHDEASVTGKAAKVEMVVEVATQVKITREIVEAFSSDFPWWTHDGPDDARDGLSAAFRAAGFEVVQ